MSGSRILKLILLIFILILVIIGIKGIDLYKKVFVANVNLTKDNKAYIYIKSDWNYDSVYNSLVENNWLKNKKTFQWTAEKKNYVNLVKPGRYQLKHRMSNNDLVNMLRSGNQVPIDFTFHNIRTIQQFAGLVSSQLEMDSLSLINHITDSEIQNKYGFNRYTMPCMFIPNTYEFYWNVSVEDFTVRMAQEYDKFWSNKRLMKAEDLGFTQEQVITLASIVNEETKKNDEKDEIAGVYINRIKVGMPLQADPTIIFAIGDFSIRRVLNVDRRVNSPYNTYKNAGLPPGPICLPDISSIDAVLNYKKHNYYYFCAKADFSGYHSFARTLSEHNKNARAYQRELNKRRIYR